MFECGGIALIEIEIPRCGHLPLICVAKIRMELDISSLWSWVMPLWGLFLLVLFLGGVLMEKSVLVALPGGSGGAASHIGGARPVKRVRFALP